MSISVLWIQIRTLAEYDPAYSETQDEFIWEEGGWVVVGWGGYLEKCSHFEYPFNTNTLY